MALETSGLYTHFCNITFDFKVKSGQGVRIQKLSFLALLVKMALISRHSRYKGVGLSVPSLESLRLLILIQIMNTHNWVILLPVMQLLAVTLFLESQFPVMPRLNALSSSQTVLAIPSLLEGMFLVAR